MSLIRKIKMLSPARRRKLAREQVMQRETVDKAIAIIKKELTESKRGLFIDCGFNTRDVFDRYHDALHDTFDFIGFEIQPELFQQAINAQSRYKKTSTEFIHAAVSANDGKLHYYEPKKWGLNYKGGSTILSEKNDRPSKKIPTKINAINFSQFIKKHAQDKYLVVKMDIEGAEYEVLKQLFADQHEDLIDLLFIEFHSKFLDSNSNHWQDTHDSLINKLDQASLRYYDWI